MNSFSLGWGIACYVMAGTVWLLARSVGQNFRYQEEIAEKDAIIELLTAKVVEVTEESMR